MTWVKPARGHGFFAGEELDALNTVSLGVTEGRILPTTERVVGNRNWNWHIDADHAYLNLILKTSGSSAIISENRSSISKGSRVNQINSFKIYS